MLRQINPGLLTCAERLQYESYLRHEDVNSTITKLGSSEKFATKPEKPPSSMLSVLSVPRHGLMAERYSSLIPTSPGDDRDVFPCVLINNIDLKFLTEIDNYSI